MKGRMNPQRVKGTLVGIVMACLAISLFLVNGTDFNGRMCGLPMQVGMLILQMAIPLGLSSGAEYLRRFGFEIKIVTWMGILALYGLAVWI
jgi:hypothetical protein